MMDFKRAVEKKPTVQSRRDSTSKLRIDKLSDDRYPESWRSRCVQDSVRHRDSPRDVIRRADLLKLTLTRFQRYQLFEVTRVASETLSFSGLSRPIALSVSIWSSLRWLVWTRWNTNEQLSRLRSCRKAIGRYGENNFAFPFPLSSPNRLNTGSCSAIPPSPLAVGFPTPPHSDAVKSKEIS